AIARFGTLAGGIAVFIGFSIASENFLTRANQLTILRQVSFLLILALGFTFALITSEPDLSFANVASLCGVVTGGLIHFGYNPILAI
ncbi:hypothetical protein ACE40M_24245, partial [Salmonella enterica]